MKKFNLYSLALATVMLGACSNEVDLANGESPVMAGENGYISMSINLPSIDKGVRGIDKYEDGTPDEYDVKDATLLIFVGDDEESATCQGVYPLDISAFLGHASNQITSTAQIVKEITKPNATNKNIYALVVLNNNNVISTTGEPTTNSLVGNTLTQINAQISANTYTSADNLKANGFLMANAPLSNMAGGGSSPSGATVTTLADIDENKIYKSENQAKNNPAATIYVERALSKVTLSGGSGNVTAQDANKKLAKYTVTGWTLDNTNQKTYLVRNTTGISAWLGYASAYTTATTTTPSTPWYRFADANSLESGVTLYRTHFGVDPNFDATDNAGATFNKVSTQNPALTNANGTTPMYCLENTFDVASMKDLYTTRAIVAAKLEVTGADSNNNDFYLLNNNTSDIYTETTAQNEVKRLWMNHLDGILDQYVKEGSFAASDVTVVWDVAKGGYIKTVTVTMADKSGISYQPNQNAQTLSTVATEYINGLIDNNQLTIAYYKGGVSYYGVRIKHFGDDETPWNATMDGVTSDISYPDNNAANWLGRYGVLRNTWYDIAVTGIKNIGSPEVPEVTTNWDDESKDYISVEINILSWAKRKQEVEL